MIRPLTAKDATIIADMHRQAFEAAWPESDMLGHIEKDIALGWDQDDALAGFILMRVIADQGEILTVAVHNDFRKQGVGLKLIRAGEAAAAKAGANIIFLEVAEDNPAGIALYKKCGYEGFGRRPAYYKREGGRVAAQLFRKNLTSPA